VNRLKPSRQAVRLKEYPVSDLEEIKLKARRFAAQRDWNQFHSPKNLVMALGVEAAELSEIFQWLTEEQSGQLSEEMRARVADEIADVQVYLVRLADRLEIDIASSVTAKMKKNEAKYPADLVRGSSKKYSEY
jgi:NTP pyrophosphatase (non-canonical NTP hydrolase)